MCVCVCARVCACVPTTEGVSLWPHFNVFDLYSCPAALGLLPSQSPCSVTINYGLWALACSFYTSGILFLFPLIVCVDMCVCHCVCVCLCIKRDVTGSHLMDRWK